MKIPLVNLETLRKFNSGSNAKAFDNDLEPGNYPVCMTVTIKGDLAKGNPGVTRSRNTTGAANVVRYLLDRINDVTFMRLERDLSDIRKGNFDLKNGQWEFDRRLDSIMPHREFPRAGSTKFNGEVIIEDIDTSTPETEAAPGLRVVGGE